MRRLAAIALLGLGCGLDEVGLGGGVDGSMEAGDVAIDVVKDVAPFVCSDGGPASCNDAAEFFAPALFSPDAGAPCPAGYDTHDLVESVPSAPSCTCVCNPGTPSCDTTQVGYKYGTGGNCVTDGGYTVSGCTMTTKTTFGGEFLEVDPPAVTGGCTGPGSPTPPVATTTNVRLCTPQCSSDDSVCTSQTGLRACVIVPGDVTNCPPNTNYTTGPFHIGSSPTTTCDNCSCTQKGDCSGSTLHGYTDQGCGQGDQSFAMDGLCHGLTGGKVGTFNSAQIMPKITNATCSASESGAHTTYGGNEFSVCCK